jgi:hypothetical protein
MLLNQEPQSAAAAPLGTVYTTRPGGLSTADTLEVSLTLSNHSVLSSGYSAVATPTFGSMSHSFSNPPFYGGYNRVVTTLQNPTAAPGANVQVDLHGTTKKNPFGGAPWLATKTLTSRWFDDVDVLVFPGIIVGKGGGGGFMAGWYYINGEWVYLEPGGGEEVVEVSVTLVNPEPDPEDGTGDIVPGQQMMQAMGYRLDSTAQSAIAGHFGAMEVDVSMIRTLGSEIDNMGFPGNIGVFDFGAAVVDPGQSFNSLFGAMPTAASDLMMVQVFATYTNPTGNMSPSTVEYWLAFDGTALGVPEPATTSMLGGVLLVIVATVRMRQRQCRDR